jgi:multimeric flavodoxin WrbA
MFDWLRTGKTQPRKGMPSPELDEAEFKRRFLSQFEDPCFEPLAADLVRVSAAAWDAYINSRKAPRTRKAGAGYDDPDYELSIDWIAAAAAVKEAARRHGDAAAPARILLINGSSRSEHTCPGEMSKTFRLAQIAQEVLVEHNAAVDFLDLSRLTSEYGRRIHPCKACFSTSPALCHWPCSCYPNYALGQTQDWMAEIYPLWVAAHGIMIVTPVNWYQPSSSLKLMIDRLVCADGGNPDRRAPTAKMRKQPKRSNLPAGVIRGTSPADCLRWSPMAIPKAPRTPPARYLIGWPPCTSNRPAVTRSSNAISATGSPTRRAMPNSTPIARCRTKSAWRRAR